MKNHLPSSRSMAPKSDSAEGIVLNFANEQNKPLNSQNVADSMQKFNLKKAAIEKALIALVGFVRMILHSGRYECGDRLSPDHKRTILERVLPYHPAYEIKIGSRVDHITGSDGLESAVANLFASAKRNGLQFNQQGGVAQCLQKLPSAGQLQANDLLLHSGFWKKGGFTMCTGHSYEVPPLYLLHDLVINLVDWLLHPVFE